MHRPDETLYHQSFTQHQLQNVRNDIEATDHEAFDYYDTEKLLFWHSDAELPEQ